MSPVELLAPAGAVLGSAVVLFSAWRDWGAHAPMETYSEPATVVGIVMAAVALILARPAHGPVTRAIGSTLAVLTALLGLFVMAHYAADAFALFPDRRFLTGVEWWNERPGPVTAAGLAFLGLALLATGSSNERNRQHAGFYAAATLVIALTGLVGHAYGSSTLYGLNRFGGTAISTALALGFVALGVVFADPTRGVAHVLAGSGPGGHLLRRLVPFVVVGPIALGWIAQLVIELEHADVSFGVALLVVALVVLLVGLSVRQALAIEGFAVERERLHARERNARAQVTDILESITDAFLAVDRAWRITYVNREAEALMRRERAELIGRNLWSEFPDAVGQVFWREYHRAQEEQRPVQVEARIEPIGRWFSVRAFPTPEGLSLYFQDVTERKQNEEELKRVTESREKLIRGFGHDVRNPLGVADSQAWLLEEGRAFGALNERQRESVLRIRKSIQTSLRLLTDLLEIHRIEAGALDVRREPIDVVQVAREAVEDYEAPAIAAGLRLEIKAPPGLAASTDPARVKQILANLLSNAVKYAAKGPVTVEARMRDSKDAEGGAWIALSVCDSGPGIPREKLEAVFEEYTRLDPHAQPGTGIGLAISRRIARMMGGDLTVASDIGRGSTFTLWLPPGQR